MAQGNVSVTQGGDGVNIHIGGQKLDAKTVEGCISAVLACGCLSNGIHIQAKCFDVIRKHNDTANCIAKCFGCS
ncbi:MAG TPA: hypothetical protein VFN10_22835 [Thermoanaerobaculia bacterium]|nr:hypothetical protein [Thermoanaerobaculia bacterium]